MSNNVRFPYIKSNRARLYRALSNVFHLSFLLMKRVFMKKVSTLKAVNFFFIGPHYIFRQRQLEYFLIQYDRALNKDRNKALNHQTAQHHHDKSHWQNYVLKAHYFMIKYTKHVGSALL